MKPNTLFAQQILAKSAMLYKENKNANFGERKASAITDFCDLFTSEDKNGVVTTLPYGDILEIFNTEIAKNKKNFPYEEFDSFYDFYVEFITDLRLRLSDKLVNITYLQGITRSALSSIEAYEYVGHNNTVFRTR